MQDITNHHPGGSDKLLSLQQRSLNRSATFTESTELSRRLAHRRSSAQSDTHQSNRSSNDASPSSKANGAPKELATADDITLWHSAPLVFAVVPAFAGLFFHNGGAVMMDILLLSFGSLFLNWSVRTPWEWYHWAQQVRHTGLDAAELEDTILEEDGEENQSTPTEALDLEVSGDAPPHEDSTATHDHRATPAVPLQDEARQELRHNEKLALLLCFVGPLFGAYLLHAIRSQLTRPAEGLVSNFNLTIFVMAAEIRPITHLIKLKQARMLYLQRVVKRDSPEVSGHVDTQDLLSRVADLELRATTLIQERDPPDSRTVATVRQSLQPQLDALNRAVRRYEKRQAAQTMQIEARFQELDGCLKDALSLAAAAARAGQRPGVVAMTIIWFANLISHTLQTIWTLALAPFRTLATIFRQLQIWLYKTSGRPRKLTKSQSNKKFTSKVRRDL